MLWIEFEKMNYNLGEFFDNHWILKWFVLPIWFMAAMLLVLYLLFSTATTVETFQIIGLFLGFSFVAVGVGLGIEYCVYRITGAELFNQRNNYE